jgi:hypothetical protein
MKCILCKKEAIFYSKKKHRMVASKDHDLCRRCYIAERQRFNQECLAEAEEKKDEYSYLHSS